jgi:hypothetical protein
MNIHQIRQAGMRAMEDAVVASLPPELRFDAPPRPKLSKWVPTTDPMTLRRMGKLTEELGELQSVAARVVIQGIDETDPSSGKVNRRPGLHRPAGGREGPADEGVGGDVRMTDTPVNALGEPSPNRTDFTRWSREGLEAFARQAADENLVLRTQLREALDAWRAEVKKGAQHV